uniref:Coiled-coil domain containing 28B n=1 Tax=Chrysolophus pictus TaxID=9089 RepID=A0A8C3PXD8_CHRPC
MEERRKKRSPRGQPAPARASRLLPTSKSASFALPLPALPSQHARPRRASKERVRAGAARGAPLQHSFLTEVSDVCEMEGGLLGLLSDFHSGKLQAFGKECSFEQLEHVREMQEKLARLHFGLDVCVEELPEEQKKPVADRNLDQLLAHVSGVSSARARPCSADGRPRPPCPRLNLCLCLLQLEELSSSMYPAGPWGGGGGGVFVLLVLVVLVYWWCWCVLVVLVY